VAPVGTSSQPTHSLNSGKMAFKEDRLTSLSPADKQLFTLFGLGQSIDKAFDTVHQAFEHQAKTNPNNVAVEDFENKITYGELDRQANCLAQTLRSCGIAPGHRVCLLTERSIFMVVGIIGILKAGGAYVPLDGNVVADKTLNHALKDSGSSLGLVQKKFVHRIIETPYLCLEDSLHFEADAGHCYKPQELSKTTDSAYIIYTSGMSPSEGDLQKLICLF
jgi:non-ribosomal peptide synthetase component F